MATNAALTTVEIEIPNISCLVKKKQIIKQKLLKLKKKLTDHDHDKYSTTPEFDNLAARVFTTRLAQENLVTKTDSHTKLISLKRKINSNKTKHLLVENELKKLKTFDLGYFIGKRNLEKDDAQNYLVSQPMIRYLILKGLVLIMIILHHRNLKDYLMKAFNLLLHLIISLILR